MRFRTFLSLCLLCLVGLSACATPTPSTLGPRPTVAARTPTPQPATAEEAIRQLILATNENNVLDEFFRTGVYRPRSNAETRQTSSPSMDISKASNFERFVFDLVGRDAATVRDLWAGIESGAPSGAAFDLSGGAHFPHIRDYGFVSGTSNHADRLATIRKVWAQYGIMVDTHTADGIKVGLELREPGIPLVCLETALPAKFDETIRAALGREPERPAGLMGIEQLPQRFVVMAADAPAIKRYIEERCR